MPSNCTIISWKGKKEMASLLLSAIGYRLLVGRWAVFPKVDTPLRA